MSLGWDSGAQHPSGPRRLKVDADAFMVLHELLPGLALPPEFSVGWMMRLNDADRRSRRAAGLVRLAEAGLVFGSADAWRLDPAVVAALTVQAAPRVGIQVQGWSAGGTLLARTAVAAVSGLSPVTVFGWRASTLARARRGDHDGPTVEVSTFDPRDVVLEVLRLVTEGVPLGDPVSGDRDRLPVEMEVHACHALAGAVREGVGQDLLGVLAPSGRGVDALLQLIRGQRAGLHVLVASAVSDPHAEQPIGGSGWCEEWLADDTGWWRLVLRTDPAARPGQVDLLRCDPVGLEDLARGLRFVLAGLLDGSAVRRG